MLGSDPKGLTPSRARHRVVAVGGFASTMGALGHLGKARHVAVGLAIAGTSALALFGVIGDGNPDMRFDTWQTIVEPTGGDAVRVTENFDQDFGDDRHHGPIREIPN